MHTRTKRGGTLLTALALACGLALSGCGASNSTDDSAAGGDDSSGGKDWGDCTPAADAKDMGSEKPGDGEKTDLTVAAFNGWDETIATAYLAKHVLGEYGYNVTVKKFDLAPGYVATSNADVDWMSSTMLPVTHKPYIEKYGDKLEAQGCWYDQAKNTIAVDKDSPAKTIEDLKSMGDQYGNKLYGIEAGSGLMDATKDKVIPDYGLDNMKLIASSTPAMLTQLQKSTSAGEHVAVTLWHPHWAYDKFPVRDLEDPKKALGENEKLYTMSRTGFTDEHPLPAQILKNLALTPNNLEGLERVMAAPEEFDGKNPEKAVAKWAKDNPDFMPDWKSGKLTAKE